MQIFHRSANVISRASIYTGIFTAAFALWACIQIQRSPYVTYAGIARPQPAPFSHEHHVAGLGIDCRYCHTSVETSSFAGIPPTKTCMNCHSQIWTNAPMLEPVRESFRSGKSLVWNRVNDLPDFVYFDHSIHINKGVGCNTCHGPVDRMPLMYNYASLQMEWCIECHRAPEKNLRPREQVFNMRYQQPTKDLPVADDGNSYTDQLSLGKHLVDKYHLRSVMDITSCSTCHR
ncbi:MAG: cytochrome C [Acidobacteria bacterium]|nr:MAG: cytochrome C [Acidobacteriota bacterium]PYV67587.1 MAG: cytochrome C [Acidobacteriota bacterium]PYV79159.1 MAG: cytochrome C [Acidobacteriota bacterium]